MSNFVSTGVVVNLPGSTIYTDIGNIFCDTKYSQTVNGVKNFTNLPTTTVTTPANPQQLVTKSYVDALGAQNIVYTGRQFNTNSNQTLASMVFSPTTTATNITQSIKTQTASTISAYASVDSPTNADQLLTFGPSTSGSGLWVAGGTATNSLAYSYDGINWVGNGTTITNITRCVAWNGKIWVMGGTNTNSLAYSYDGIVWTGLTNTIFTADMRSVAWNGLMWVAVGTGTTNTIAYSYNGITWTGIGVAIFSMAGYAVAWNGIMWVAVGAGSVNSLAYSYNGIVWYGNSVAIFSMAGYAVAWNGTMWIAGGVGTANTLAYSLNGINWTGLSNTLFTTNVAGLCWNGIMWVAVGQGTNTIGYSYNGTTWFGLGQTVTFTTAGTAVSWNGTMWIAGGSGAANTLMYSYNGINWYGLGITIFSTNCYAVGWAGMRPNVFYLPASRTLALGSGTSGTIAYAFAGTGSTTDSWTNGITHLGYSTNTLFAQATAAAWNGTKWIALGTTVGSLATGNTMAYSSVQNYLYNQVTSSVIGPNAIGNAGNVWVGMGNYVFTVAGNGIGWNGNVWVAVGQGANTIAYSPDGFAWIGLGTSIFSTAGLSAIWNGTYWLATGAGSSHTMAVSVDGVVWAGLGKSVFTIQTNYAAWSGALWVACGQGGNTLAVSADTLSWCGLGATIFTTSGYSVAAGSGNSLANGTANNMWVATGSGTNTLAYSADGINWTAVGSIFTTAGNSVTWNGKFFVAAGQGTNTLAYSPNGVTWTGETTTSPFSTTGVGAGIVTNLGVGGTIVAPNYSITTQPLWVAAGTKGNSVLTAQNYSTLAYSYNGITWSGVQNSPFEIQGNSVAYSPSQKLWVATGSATQLYNIISTTGLVFYYNFNKDSFSGSTIYNYATGAYSIAGAATMYTGGGAGYTVPGTPGTGFISTFSAISGTAALSLNNISSGNPATQITTGGNYVQIPSFVTPPAIAGSGISLCFWVNSNGLYNVNLQDAYILDFGNGSWSDNISVYLNAGTGYTNGVLNIGIKLYQGTVANGWNYDTTTVVSDITFHHIVWTISYVSSSSVIWGLYIDGIQVFNYTGASSIWPNPVLRNYCYIGKPTMTVASSTVNNPTSYFNGVLDEFRYYSRTISAAEVATLYNTRTNTPSVANTLAYSSNGITWTGLGNSVFSGVGQSVVWNGTMWVASGAGTNTLGYSYNGTVWLGSGASVFTTSGYGMAWNGFLWVATGMGTNTLAYSYNGVNWTGLGATVFTASGQSVAWNGIMWVAVGLGTNTVAYSYNGYNWTGLTTTVFGTAGYGVAWNGQIWVVAGTGTNAMAWSATGITWTGLGTTVAAVGYLSAGYSVSWNGQQWLAAGSGVQGNIVYSPNGKLWYTTTNNIFNNVYGVGNNNYFTGNQIQVAASSATNNQTFDVVSDSYYQSGFSEITVGIIPKSLSIFSSTPFILNGGTQVINGSYLVATFAKTGANTFTVNRSGFINMILIAGGGGGGISSNRTGGGGGAGGYILLNNYFINAGSYTVTVGVGGGSATSGSNTVFGSYSAIGGGSGGYLTANGGTGGSGGGGFHGSVYYGVGGPGAGTAGQGFTGALGYDGGGSGPFAAGGGGGAFSAGQAASFYYGGAGGAPLLLGPAIFPGYNNVIAVCGGGGGSAQTIPTTSYTNIGGAGGGLNYNRNSFRSGGWGLYWDYILDASTFVPANGGIAGNAITYGGGGGGSAATSGGAQGLAGSGAQGACIITYSLANSSVFYNNPIINLDASTGISASTWIDSANGLNYTFYTSAGNVNPSGNSVILSNGQTVAYFNNTYATSLTGLSTYLHGSYTHDVWLCPLSIGNSTIISETVTTSVFNVDYMAIYSNNLAASLLTGTGAGTWSQISSLAAATTNTWYHVVSVFNVANNSLTLYVNGVQQSTSTLTRLITTNTFNYNMMNSVYYIGRPSGIPAGNGYFNGYVGAVKLYGYPLTASQVASNYTTFLPRYQNVSTTVTTNVAYTFRIKATSTTVPTTDSTGLYPITNSGLLPISISNMSDPVVAVADPTGTRGYVLQFFGKQYLSVFASSPVTSTRTFWLYSATPSSGAGNVFSGTNYKIYFNGTAYLSITGVGTTVNSTVAQTANWVFYAVTTTATAVTLYINGIQNASGAMAAYTGDTTAIQFGAYNGTASSFYTGYMDDIRQYPYVLTNAQITAIYNGQ